MKGTCLFRRKFARVIAGVISLQALNVSFVFAAETGGATPHAAESPSTTQKTAGDRATPRLNLSQIENHLTIGKSNSENLAPQPTIDYERRQNAAAIGKLETIKQLRGSTNNWEEVSRLLKEIISADASRSIKSDVKKMARLELAGIAERNGQHAQALQYLAEFAELYQDDIIIPEIYLRQAYIFRQMGAYKSAISKLYLVMTAALRIKAENLGYYERVVLTAQSEIAETHMLEGDFKRAAELFSRLLNQPTEELNVPIVSVKIIRCLARSGDQDGVIRNASAFLNDYPASEHQAEIRYLLASAYKSRNDKQEALRELLLLLEAVEVAEPKLAARWKSWKMLAGNEIGNQLFLDNDMVPALQVYRGLLNLDEGIAWKLPIYYQIGLCYEKQEYPVEAVNAYRAILSLAEKHPNLEPSLKMVVDMARFREDILSWKLSVDEKTRQEPKVAEKTN